MDRRLLARSDWPYGPQAGRACNAKDEQELSTQGQYLKKQKSTRLKHEKLAMYYITVTKREYFLDVTALPLTLMTSFYISNQIAAISG